MDQIILRSNKSRSLFHGGRINRYADLHSYLTGPRRETPVFCVLSLMIFRPIMKRSNKAKGNKIGPTVTKNFNKAGLILTDKALQM